MIDSIISDIRFIQINCPEVNQSVYEREIDFLKSLKERVQHCLMLISSFLNTLEVKEVEVDLGEEMDKEWNKCKPIDEGMGLEIASIEHEQFDNIAKHFFELGIKARKEEVK